MEIDEDRSYLYLLCSNSIVKIYTINLEHSKITEHVIFDASKVKLPKNKTLQDRLALSTAISIGICSKKYSKVAKFIIQYRSGARGFFSIFEHYTENKKQYCAEMVHFVYPKELNLFDTLSGPDGFTHIGMSVICDAGVNLCLHKSNNEDMIQSVFFAQQVQAQMGEVYPVTNYEICKCDLSVSSIVPFKFETSKHCSRRRPYYFSENTTVQGEFGSNLYLIFGIEGYCILRVTEIVDVVEKTLLTNDSTDYRRFIDDFIQRYGLMTIFSSLLSLHVKLFNSNDDLKRDILYLIMEAFHVKYHFKIEKSFDKGYEIVLVPFSGDDISKAPPIKASTNNFSMVGTNDPLTAAISYNDDILQNHNLPSKMRPVLPPHRSNTLYGRNERFNEVPTLRSGNTALNQTVAHLPTKCNEMAHELDSLCEKFTRDSRKRKANNLASTVVHTNEINGFDQGMVYQTNAALNTLPDIGPQYLNQMSIYSLGFNQFFSINVDALFNSLVVDQSNYDDGPHYYFPRLKIRDVEYWQDKLSRIMASFNECRFMFYSKFENVPLIDSVDILNAKTVKTLDYLLGLADKSVQLLNLFAIIYEHDLDKFMKHLIATNNSISTLKTTKFGSYVVNLSLTRELISNFINYINTIGCMQLRSTLKQLTSLCGSFLDSTDMKFILINRYLIDIFNMTEGHEKVITLKNTLISLREINRSVSTISCFELLVELECTDEALVLASLRFSYLVEAKNSKCGNDEKTYLLYFVISVLDLYYRKNFNPSSKSTDNPFSNITKILLDEVANKQFHFVIYYWAILHNLTDLMIQINSPYITEFLSLDMHQVSKFLNDVCGVNPSPQFYPKRLLLLWKIQENNNKTHEAAKTLICLSQIVLDSPETNPMESNFNQNSNDTSNTNTLTEHQFQQNLNALISQVVKWNKYSNPLHPYDKIKANCDLNIINYVPGCTFNITIHDRLDYLGRAMIYLKNNIADHSLFISSAIDKSERASNFLVECESSIKAAKMQLFVFEEVKKINLFASTPASNQLLRTLFYSLFTYLELINGIVEPYGLHCSKLMSLIQLGVSTQDDYLTQLWKSIIEREFYLVLRSDSPIFTNKKLSLELKTLFDCENRPPDIVVRNSLKDIFKCFQLENTLFFPLYDIFRIVHIYSCQYMLDYSWCLQLMLAIQMEIFKVIEFYIRLLSDPVNDISYDKQKNISYPVLCALSCMEFVFNCEEFQMSLTMANKTSYHSSNKKIKNKVKSFCELGVIIQKQLPSRIVDPKKRDEHMRRIRNLITGLSTIHNSNL